MVGLLGAMRWLTSEHDNRSIPRFVLGAQLVNISRDGRIICYMASLRGEIWLKPPSRMKLIRAD